MFLIVGLGNPGKQYKYTRHNLGFMVVEKLAHSFKVSFKKRKLFWIARTDQSMNNEVVLIKPTTYMNLSGIAVDFAVTKYKIDISHLLIICDDINLLFGTIRIRSKGSAGGQKGLRSVIDTLGTHNFPRLRIGIGNNFSDAVDFVLSPFNKTEQEYLSSILNYAADAVEYFVLNGIELTMSRFNKNYLDI